MTKFNVGDKVRVIGRGAGRLPIGTLAVVVDVDHDGDVTLDNGKFYLNYNLELAPDNDRRLTDAEAKIASLEAEVKALKDASKPTTFSVKPPVIRADVDIERIASELFSRLSPTPQTPNQRRADVIKRAQAFVADLEKTKHVRAVTNLNGYPESYYPHLDEVEYVVNSDKRTVVALMKYTSEQTVWAKAFAKCAPDDVFNADIGKAIALGRALGVKVPEEFTDAVKPTEMVVGMAITSLTNLGNPFEYRNVTKVDRNKVWGHDSRRGSECYMYKDAGERYGAPCINPQIIDDTDAVYL